MIQIYMKKAIQIATKPHKLKKSDG